MMIDATLRKSAFCIHAKTKAHWDHLHSNRAADQRLDFRYIDSTGCNVLNVRWFKWTICQK